MLETLSTQHHEEGEERFWGSVVRMHTHVFLGQRPQNTLYLTLGGAEQQTLRINPREDTTSQKEKNKYPFPRRSNYPPQHRCVAHTPLGGFRMATEYSYPQN